MKRILLIIMLHAMALSCAQTYPLNTDYLTVANNSYLKDINNELDQFIGTYKAAYQNYHHEIYITKETHKHITILNKSFYQDVLIIRFITKDAHVIFPKNRNEYK